MLNPLDTVCGLCPTKGSDPINTVRIELSTHDRQESDPFVEPSSVCDPTTTEPDARVEPLNVFAKPPAVETADELDCGDDKSWPKRFSGPEAFPLDCLPVPVSDYIRQQSRSLGCDETAVAAPVLSALASAIGRSHRIRLKSSRTEPAVIWTAVITEPGSCKRSALDAAVGPLMTRQADALRRQQRAMPQYERELALYRAEDRRRGAKQRSDPLQAVWVESAIRDDKGSEPCSAQRPPRVPTADRLVAHDWNVRALLRQLTRQSRSPLVCCEELDGWLARAHSSSNLAHWYDLHAGQSLVIERANSVIPQQAPDPAVSLTGTVTLETLTKKLLKTSASSGLLGRLLFAHPSLPTVDWRDEDDAVIEAGAAEYAAVLNRLADLHVEGDNDQDFEPTIVELAPEARQRLTSFREEFHRKQMDVHPDLADSFLHLRGYAARFALVLHLARWASGEAVDPIVCDATSMQRGITLADWFGNEMIRVHTWMCEEAATRDRVKLLEWIFRRGKAATARELRRSNVKKYPSTFEAEAALQSVADSGLGQWIDVPTRKQGGRPTRLLTMDWEGVREWMKRDAGVGSTAVGGQDLAEGSAGTYNRPQEGFVGRNCDESPTTITGEQTSAEGSELRAQRQPEGFVGQSTDQFRRTEMERNVAQSNAGVKSTINTQTETCDPAFRRGQQPRAEQTEQRRSRNKAGRQARRKGRRKVCV